MAVPTVTSVTPATGSLLGGTSVALVGTGFTGTTAVAFGTKAATSFHVVDDTHLTAVAPAGAAAAQVDIIVTNATGPSVAASGDHFTYSATYTQPDGTADGTTYFEDVQISPATVKDGTLKDRLDPVRFPGKGVYGVAKVGS